MAVVVVTGLFSILTDYLQCRPTRAMWDFSYPRSACVSRETFRDHLYIASSFFFLADIILSCLPFFLLRKMRLSFTDKLLVCSLMSLGLLATSAIIPKLLALHSLETTQDISWVASDATMWSFVEISLGVIAACAPALKKPVENQMRKFGMLPAQESDAIIQSNEAVQRPKTFRTWFDGIRNASRPHIGVIESYEDGVHYSRQVGERLSEEQTFSLTTHLSRSSHKFPVIEIPASKTPSTSSTSLSEPG